MFSGCADPSRNRLGITEVEHEWHMDYAKASTRTHRKKVASAYDHARRATIPIGSNHDIEKSRAIVSDCGTEQPGLILLRTLASRGRTDQV